MHVCMYKNLEATPPMDNLKSDVMSNTTTMKNLRSVHSGIIQSRKRKLIASSHFSK